MLYYFISTVMSQEGFYKLAAMLDVTKKSFFKCRIVKTYKMLKHHYYTRTFVKDW